MPRRSFVRHYDRVDGVPLKSVFPCTDILRTRQISEFLSASTLLKVSIIVTMRDCKATDEDVPFCTMLDKTLRGKNDFVDRSKILLDTEHNFVSQNNYIRS